MPEVGDDFSGVKIFINFKVMVYGPNFLLSMPISLL